MDEWVSSFNVESRDQIKITLLLERMVNDRDGGTWFKRNFMIAMGFSLIESCPNGQVQPYLLRTLEDVRTLRKWNWGGFVLKTLVDQKRNWLNNARTVFVGPTLFLLLFYVDRFEVHMTKHPRLYPVLVNWDSKDLRKRQKVEKDDRYFGGGSLCEPISLPDMTHDVDSEDTVQSELEITMMKQAIMISDGVKILQSLLARASDAQRESQVFMDNLANVSRISGVTLDIHYRGDGAGTSGCKEDDESFNNNPVNDSEVYEPLQDLMDTRPIYSEQQTVHDFTFSHGNDEVGTAGGCDMYGIHSHHEKLVNVCTNPGLEDDCTFELNRVGDNSTVTDNDEITNACSEGTGVHSVGENISFGKDVECVPNMDNENIAHTDNAAISDQVRDKRKGKMVSTRGRDVPFVGLRKSKRVRVKGNVIQENDGNVSVDVPLLPTAIQAIAKTPKKSSWLKTSKFRSPFVQREVSTSKRLTKQEKEIGLYCLYSETYDGFQELFSHKDFVITRYEMQSFRKGCMVNPSIINAWCLVLNNQEDIRSNTSPLRFFATTSIYSECIRLRELSYEDQSELFNLTMSSELESYQRYPLHLIDIFFFPIFDDGLYYALSVDAKRERIYILDSTVDASIADIGNKYERVCNILRKLMVDLLYNLSVDQKARKVSKAKVHVANMKWADTTNLEDTGIYLMRHLETFMGDASPSWKCISPILMNRQLRVMRVRYCATLVKWEGNHHRDDIGKQAARHWSEVYEKSKNNVNLLLIG
ncbi:uncharacterized protein LOC131010679 isoform X2 [Salvia miltiorrhiza]|uniref:uncharacterized protein LOC131010679 isoform X2 n=1 Tax=Salvia miltiorrhiza TaxID=226208 RepID=UPI0025AC9F32|nr:uncharacterized protein LOC131010679 isoform X2 [Salvia miltiorrhiza]